jgi:hypothetical protein
LHEISYNYFDAVSLGDEIPPEGRSARVGGISRIELASKRSTQSKFNGWGTYLSDVRGRALRALDHCAGRSGPSRWLTDRRGDIRLVAESRISVDE